MKRFQYNLDTVLDYKNQVLDNLKTEHAAITQSVNQKREDINRLHGQLNGYHSDFDQTKTSGATIENYRLYSMCIDRMEQMIKEENKRLAVLEEKQEKKKNEVVEARVDTSKFEKLKDKKLVEYRKAELKEEESFIEERALRIISVKQI